MKRLSRDFTIREKILLCCLSLILIAVFYVQFVDQPVRRGIEEASVATSALQAKLDAVESTAAQLRNMREELDHLEEIGAAIMPSYNNSKAEVELLNDILNATVEYTISFSSPTRNGDQVRRSFHLSFSVSDYDMMRDVIARLANSPFRCILSDLQCSTTNHGLSVSVNGTFYETMVGGSSDIVLSG